MSNDDRVRNMLAALKRGDFAAAEKLLGELEHSARYGTCLTNIDGRLSARGFERMAHVIRTAITHALLHDRKMFAGLCEE